MTKRWKNNEIVTLVEEFHKVRDKLVNTNITVNNKEIIQIRMILNSCGIQCTTQQILTRASGKAQKPTLLRNVEEEGLGTYLLNYADTEEFPVLKIERDEKESILSLVNEATMKSFNYNEVVNYIEEYIQRHGTTFQLDQLALIPVESNQFVEFLREKINQVLTKKYDGSPPFISRDKIYYNPKMKFKTSKLSIDQLIKKKSINQIEKSSLNSLRSIAGSINNHDNILKQKANGYSGFEDTSGTGTGKSYSSDQRFINVAGTGNKKVARLFTTPQKTHKNLNLAKITGKEKLLQLCESFLKK